MDKTYTVKFWVEEVREWYTAGVCHTLRAAKNLVEELFYTGGIPMDCLKIV